MSQLLPNGKQTFLDGNGRPLAFGKVYYYIPNTSSFKNTYQDYAQTTLNTNPIVLDASGSCVAYGTGSYRQAVYDANNNLIWDKTVYSSVSDEDFNVISNANYPLTDYAALRAYTGSATIVNITQSGIAGPFARLASAATDNGGTIIVDGLGRAYQRLFVGPISIAWFEAVGDYNPSTGTGTDDTTAFVNAITYAASVGTAIQLESKKYKITDTLTIDYGSYKFTMLGSILGSTGIYFVNTTVNKPLISLTPNSSHSVFRDIEFVDVNVRTSMALRISGYPLPGTAVNWKNFFENCRWVTFKTGASFTTDGNPLIGTQMDVGSENMFLNNKWRNCELTILCQNLQSVNNTFVGSDIENDEAGETFTMIRDEAGGEMKWFGGSLIGRGTVYQQYIPPGSSGLWPSGKISFYGPRLEARSTHVGVIFEQVVSSSIIGGMFSEINVYGMKVIQFGQTIDLLRYSGRMMCSFNDINSDGGTLYINQNPVAGISANDSTASQGAVLARNCRNLKYKQDTSNTYGTYNRQKTGHVLIENPMPSTNATATADAYGFYSVLCPAVEQLGYRMGYATPKRLIWNDDQETAGFKNLYLILPKYGKPLKFGLYRQPVNIASPIQMKLYLVKDVANWATPGTFNVATDAYLVADSGSLANIAGDIEIPIQVTSSIFGNKLESGAGTWTEGRMFVEQSGTVNFFGGAVWVEYL